MKRNPTSGTTLLELLVSLAIMAMLAVVMTSLVSSGRKVWDRSDTLFATQEEALARVQVRRALEAMPIPKPHLREVQLLKGTATELRWLVAAVSLGRDTAETLEYRVGLAASDGEDYLGVFERVLNSEEEMFVGRLTAQVDGVEITYYRWDVEPERREWLPVWTDPSLPRLVKISTNGPDGQARPPLTIEPAKLERQSLISLSSLLPPG